MALVVSSMIGTGIFTTTGFMVGDLGAPWQVLAVWALAGGLALAGAAVYAELGAMMPRAGGEYVYLTRAYHPAVGFLAGWIAVFVGFSAPIAASALAFGRYLHAIAPAVNVRGAAFALVALTTVAHARDVRRAGFAQTALTASILAVVVAFAVAALASGRLEASRLATSWPLSPSTGGAGAWAVSLVYATYAYFGWNAAAYVAGEVRAPDRTLPRALVGGVALVAALYLGLNAVFLAAAPRAALAGQVEVGDVAARALFGDRGGAAMSAAIALALGGSVSALVMTGARVVKAMADDGVLFGALGRINGRGAPTAAVVLLGALATLGVGTSAVEPLLVYAGFTLTLSSAATVASAFVLRRREPAATRPHRALAWPWSGAAYLALAAFMLAFGAREKPLETLAGAATLAGGGVAWALWRRRRR
ncbi:MAG: amino acid permease-associated region [Myxococcales bacterium]|nr:amino acid permease-associated region [Myxococcales bacterium]